MQAPVLGYLQGRITVEDIQCDFIDHYLTDISKALQETLIAVDSDPPIIPESTLTHLQRGAVDTEYVTNEEHVDAAV